MEKLTHLQILYLSRTLPEHERKKLAALIVADLLNPIPMHDIAEDLNDLAFKKQEAFDVAEECDEIDKIFRSQIKKISKS